MAGIGLYFVLMAWFVALGGLIVRAIPFYRGEAGTTGPGGKYYPQLEGLRGVLALSVFIHHGVVWQNLLKTGHWEMPSSNFYAQMAVFPVTMFFFLTGFLFWSKLQREKGMRLVSFYRSRFLRIAPAYAFAVGLLFLGVFAFTDFQVREPLQALLGQMTSWLLFALRGTGVAINGFHPTTYLLIVVWTLRLEWIFYAVIPFLGWFSRSLGRTLGFVGACELLDQALGIAAARPGMPAGVATAGWMAHFFAVGFAGGILVAALTKRFGARAFARSTWATAAIAGLFIVLFLGVRADYGLPEMLLLIPIFLLIAWGNSFGGFLTGRTVTFLGRISYSVYLLHPLVLGAGVMALQRLRPDLLATPLSYLIMLAIAGVCVIALATFSHRFFEAPFVGKSSGRSPASGAVDAITPLSMTRLAPSSLTPTSSGD